MPTVLDPVTSLLDPSLTYGDFRDALAREGFAVVPAIDPSKSAEYAAGCQDWVESFGLGYKRDDPATYKEDCLPPSFKGGLFNRYGVAHEQLCWDIRQEQGVIDAFAAIWGTSDLLVSFDGLNVSVPGVQSATRPWPHVDQSPTRSWLHCIQGIVNLSPNGPDDGGLMVMMGSRMLFNKLFETFAEDMPEGGWSQNDVYVFSDKQQEWLLDQGCKWHKVCADPGDLILWDSRTCHFGALPNGPAHRIATYVCYKPASHATAKQLARKVAAFGDPTVSLSHDPLDPRIESSSRPMGPEGDNGAYLRALKAKCKPAQPAILSAVGRKLAGLDPY